MKYIFFADLLLIFKILSGSAGAILSFFCLTNASASFVRPRRERQHVDIFSIIDFLICMYLRQFKMVCSNLFCQTHSSQWSETKQLQAISLIINNLEKCFKTITTRR